MTDSAVMEICWAAGFLEGDGWFGKPKPGKNKPMQVVVGQVDKEPVERLQKLFGGSLRLAKKMHMNWQPVWYWTISGAQAACCMMTVYTLMSTRRKKSIKAALAIWKTQRRWCNIPGYRNFNSKLGGGSRWKGTSLERPRPRKETL